MGRDFAGTFVLHCGVPGWWRLMDSTMLRSFLA